MNPLLVLTPASLIFQPLNLILSSLVFTSIPVAAAFLLSFYYMSSYFEASWGRRELIKHFLIVNVATNLLVCIILIFEYAVTFNDEYLFTPIAGLGPFLSSLIVAYKRAIPEHNIKLFHVFTIRAKWLPSLNILLHFVLFVLGMISTLFYNVLVGSVVSWVYIRYYKYHDGVMGDRSETFSFASFFPDSWIGFLKPISTLVYTTLVRFKLLPPLPPRRRPQTIDSSIEEGSKTEEQNAVPPPLPRAPTEETIFTSHAATDSLRRKELAEKALAERLLQKKESS